MIQKTEQQDVDFEGRRLLNQALAPLGWVLNRIEDDFGIDYDLQVFVEGNADGLWLKIQLKSSASSNLSSDGSFISQQLSLDHAKHYALELREPAFLVHADTKTKKVHWYAPQLDNELIRRLADGSISVAATVRVPTRNLLPDTARDLLEVVGKVSVVLANRTLANTSVSSFAESLKYQPGEDSLREEFQLKNDVLKLRRIHELLGARQYTEARTRARVVTSDPDASLENRFWAEMNIGIIDWADAVNKNRPQSELPLIYLENARTLQALAESGPSHLKFFALICRKAAELDKLARDNWGLTILLHQHLGRAGNPLMAPSVYAAQAISTIRVIRKYNQCLRLARYASHFKGRWILPSALTRIPQSAGSFISRIGRLTLTEIDGSANQFRSSALQICKLVAWIGEESGDQEVIALATSAALLPVNSRETDEFKWSVRTLDRISDPDIKSRAIQLIERHVARWTGRAFETDSYRGDPARQLMENAAASLGIDPSDENNPLVRSLRLAAKDNTPARILKTCEHILSSMGATGPMARKIEILFGIQTAGSKIIHCALHNYHHEARGIDSAFAEFRLQHCDSCPDRSPRPVDWQWTEAFQEEFNAKHGKFVRDFNATGAGYRFTSSD
jgi:hypothetical protein